MITSHSFSRLVSATMFAGLAFAASPQSSGSAPAKQETAKSQQQGPMNGVSTGEIVSLDTKRLVLSRKKDGQAEELTFILTPQTVRKGQLAVGQKATVHYQTKGHEHIATSIQPTVQKAQQRTN